MDAAWSRLKNAWKDQSCTSSGMLSWLRLGLTLIPSGPVPVKKNPPGMLNIASTKMRAWSARSVQVAEWPVKRASIDRKSTRLNSSHGYISYAVFCLKKKNNILLYLMMPGMDGFEVF